jgi:hypothetical protein
MGQNIVPDTAFTPGVCEYNHFRENPVRSYTFFRGKIPILLLISSYED